VLSFLEGLPAPLVYALLGLGAALENVVPPVPADTFALLGGFLSGRGALNAWMAWLATWLLNVTSALLVYAAGRRHGKSFFEKGIGKHILHGHQLQRMRRFYERFGAFAIFFTRFLPGLRAVVPAFAGVSHQPLLPVLLPLTLASAIWYGALVWLGATAGRNLETLMGWVDRANLVLLGVAVVVFAGLFLWWWRSRREGHG
jgi:membrane protein DedA with SNARE-associated domain